MLPVTLADGDGERGLDLHLQLAGDGPAAHYVGTVHRGIGLDLSMQVSLRDFSASDAAIINRLAVDFFSQYSTDF